jgi:hypothetical protein
MPETPIPKDILNMTVQLAMSAKSQGADWISNPGQMAIFIETISRKLLELNQGKP